jgi:hypothetical protein
MIKHINLCNKIQILAEILISNCSAFAISILHSESERERERERGKNKNREMK